MNAYLDASVLVAMFTLDDHSADAVSWLRGANDRLSLSSWSLTEFTSALGVGERSGRLGKGQRTAAEAALQAWLRSVPGVAGAQPDDVFRARVMIQAIERPLRAGDALHLAVAERLGDAVATFDRQIALAASDLGLPVEDLSPHA